MRLTHRFTLPSYHSPLQLFGHEEDKLAVQLEVILPRMSSAIEKLRSDMGAIQQDIDDKLKRLQR
jgi:hypothetical protein